MKTHRLVRELMGCAIIDTIPSIYGAMEILILHRDVQAVMHAYILNNYIIVEHWVTCFGS